jgi:hypothetical protein
MLFGVDQARREAPQNRDMSGLLRRDSQDKVNKLAVPTSL